MRVSYVSIAQFLIIWVAVGTHHRVVSSRSNCCRCHWCEWCFMALLKSWSVRKQQCELFWMFSGAMANQHRFSRHSLTKSACCTFLLHRSWSLLSQLRTWAKKIFTSLSVYWRKYMCTCFAATSKFSPMVNCVAKTLVFSLQMTLRAYRIT